MTSTQSDYLEAMERQLGMWGSVAQERVGRATVAVGGVGGIGAISALMVAKAGFGRIRLCDRDTYGLENIVEQAFATYDAVGREKADVAARELVRHTRHGAIDAWTGDLAEAAHAARLVDGADIVISGVDNVAARLALGRACAEARVPMVVSANVGWSVLHTVYTPEEEGYAAVWRDVEGLRRGKDGFPDLVDPETRARVEREWTVWVVAMAGFEGGALRRFLEGDQGYLWYAAPPAYFAASLGVMDALKIVTGRGEPTIFPTVFYYDLKHGRVLSWEDFSGRRKRLNEVWDRGSDAIVSVAQEWE